MAVITKDGIANGSRLKSKGRGLSILLLVLATITADLVLYPKEEDPRKGPPPLLAVSFTADSTNPANVVQRRKNSYSSKRNSYTSTVVAEKPPSLAETMELRRHHPDPAHIMTAYLEATDFEDWGVKPLRNRTTAGKHKLQVLSFPQVNSCHSVPGQFAVPANTDIPDHFLPWIHDAFPLQDGQDHFIQFVAQNRRRCHTGTTKEEERILAETRPSEALFQHVPVKRVLDNNETRYKLATSHEGADSDGVATRFLCRFKPTMEETLSVFNFDYEWASYRRKHKKIFQEDTASVKAIHLSQLLFRCPVPSGMIELLSGDENSNGNWTTLFVDVIPIRTPTRYGPPNRFLQPRYNDSLTAPTDPSERFDARVEWGPNHLLPRIEDSGRWENIPICESTTPALKIYKTKPIFQTAKSQRRKRKKKKKHKLAACISVSARYTTRGGRYEIKDGHRRLHEWIHLHQLVGFDHFYIYDASLASPPEENTNSTDKTRTLKSVVDSFSSDLVTYIEWPHRNCNMNPNNVDSPGELSSLNAAVSSCRLRFGPETEWLSHFSVDEYVLPMGIYRSMLPILDQYDKRGIKIITFPSWRNWPRRDFIEKPVPIKDPAQCGTSMHECFELEVSPGRTMLQAYSCGRTKPGARRDKVMPAEKQIYRPEYVKQHTQFYSTVTTLSEMSRREFEAAGYDWVKQRIFPDPNSRPIDESTEATMLHSKAIARQDTSGWLQACRGADNSRTCRIGVPFPDPYDFQEDGPKDKKGWMYNCYVNYKVDDYWVPLLERAMWKSSPSYNPKADPGEWLAIA